MTTELLSMEKLDVMKIWKTTENLSRLLGQSRPLYCKVAVVSALIVMLLVTSSIVLHQQQMDNVTFSHHKASVNGIQMHFVIGGKGDPVVLLHGWPQAWYEWHTPMQPSILKT
jgi:hypothetical protein